METTQKNGRKMHPFEVEKACIWLSGLSLNLFWGVVCSSTFSNVSCILQATVKKKNQDSVAALFFSATICSFHPWFILK